MDSSLRRLFFLHISSSAVLDLENRSGFHRRTRCKVSSSYFLSLFLLSPVLKLNLFSYFLAGEAKICSKIENGIYIVIVVCVLE